MSSSSIRPIIRTLSDATILDQSGPVSKGNEAGTPHPSKLQERSITPRLFSVILGHLLALEWGLTPQ